MLLAGEHQERLAAILLRSLSGSAWESHYFTPALIMRHLSCSTKLMALHSSAGSMLGAGALEDSGCARSHAASSVNNWCSRSVLTAKHLLRIPVRLLCHLRLRLFQHQRHQLEHVPAGALRDKSGFLSQVYAGTCSGRPPKLLVSQRLHALASRLHIPCPTLTVTAPHKRT